MATVSDKPVLRVPDLAFGEQSPEALLLWVAQYLANSRTGLAIGNFGRYCRLRDGLGQPEAIPKHSNGSAGASWAVAALSTSSRSLQAVSTCAKAPAAGEMTQRARAGYELYRPIRSTNSSNFSRCSAVSPLVMAASTQRDA